MSGTEVTQLRSDSTSVGRQVGVADLDESVAAEVGFVAAVPHMLDAGGGSIVNIASAAGRHASRGFTAYGTAKAAMIQLTRTMAADLAPRIRVNAIAPGAIVTDALASVLNDDLQALMEAGTPMRRIGEVDDIAAAAVYLASEASSYVTGQILPVDGGIQTSNFDMGIPDL